MIEMLHCHWLNKNKYKLDKLNLTRLWVLVTIYQKNTWLFVLVTIYPKIKRKTKHKFIYPKELSSGARLRNEKVLGTHSTQTESGLLDSNDQYALLCMILNGMLNIHDKHWPKLTHINLSYECVLSFRK